MESGKMKTYHKHCAACGNFYIGRRSNSVYCSESCKYSIEMGMKLRQYFEFQRSGYEIEGREVYAFMDMPDISNNITGRRIA